MILDPWCHKPSHRHIFDVRGGLLEKHQNILGWFKTAIFNAFGHSAFGAFKDKA